MFCKVATIFIVYLVLQGNSLPIVISRYGGRSRRCAHARQIIQERDRRIRYNTCSLACLTNKHIKIGFCPNNLNEYKKLYTRDSFSYLEDYYKNRCDIVVEEKKNPLFATFLILLGLFIFIFCAR